MRRLRPPSAELSYDVQARLNEAEESEAPVWVTVVVILSMFLIIGLGTVKSHVQLSSRDDQQDEVIDGLTTATEENRQKIAAMVDHMLDLNEATPKVVDRINAITETYHITRMTNIAGEKELEED